MQGALGSAYLTPKHLMGYFSDQALPEEKALIWSKMPNAAQKEAKLDYISLFGEESKPDMNLVKIYAKKHHNVPGPEKYFSTPHTFIYSGGQARRCKFLPGSRITSTEDIIQSAKRTKTPGPNAYKTKHTNCSTERRTTGASSMKSKTDQLQMFNDRAYYSKIVPGHKYHSNYVSDANFKRKVITDILIAGIGGQKAKVKPLLPKD